ncbi:DUF1661 domain-containing protein [Porphyromonas gulae]|nr:DUF1661 domain-containing protein [Porphyromonas gulae]
MSFPEKWLEIFFVPARKFFTSRAGAKKFTRHVFRRHKRENSRA